MPTTPGNTCLFAPGVKLGCSSRRYLAPAISKCAVAIQREKEREPTLYQEARELRRGIVNLHQRWGKVREKPKDNDTVTRERARKSDVETRELARMVLRKNQTWERDSVVRAAYDPEYIILRPRLERTFSFINQFHVQRMDKGTFE